MTSFYEKAMDNEKLGPFFRHELGDDMQSEDWIEHIDLLADFWLAKILGENTYYGNFIGAHIKLPRIEKEHFASWLELFFIAADEVYIPEIAEVFKKKGVAFSKEFMNSKLKI